MFSLHDKDIVNRNDIDVLNTLSLKFIKFPDIIRYLSATSPRERSWNTDLTKRLHFLVLQKQNRKQKKTYDEDLSTQIEIDRFICGVFFKNKRRRSFGQSRSRFYLGDWKNRSCDGMGGLGGGGNSGSHNLDTRVKGRVWWERNKGRGAGFEFWSSATFFWVTSFSFFESEM